MRKVEIMIPEVAYESVKRSLQERFACDFYSYQLTAHANDKDRVGYYRGAKYVMDYSDTLVVSLRIEENLLQDLFDTIACAMAKVKSGKWEMTSTPVEVFGQADTMDYPQRLAHPHGKYLHA